MKIKFQKNLHNSADTIIVTASSAKDTIKLDKSGDKALDKFAVSALKKNKNYKAKNGEVLTLTLPESHKSNHLIILGLDSGKTLSEKTMQDAGGKLCVALKGLNSSHADLIIPESKNCSEISANIAYGALLRSYNFDLYKSKDKDDKGELKNLDIICQHHSDAAKQFKTLESIASGVFAARDLVNEPPNTLYPESYAKRVKDDLKPLGVEIEILDDKKLEKMGAGAIMAVGQGSERKPRMVIMKWNGGKKSDAPLLLVGKGVTFDTGGISLKPGAGMDEMKMDMGGSAAVVGTMKAIASRKAKANVVAIIGLAENMPSHNAYRPGDVIKSYSGKTIEVLNTDAEGRLVLADCLTYGQEICKPAAIIDLATLTGAIMVALGHEYCGSFVTHDDLWKNMENASLDTGEKLWRMPLDDVFKKDMEGNFGDLQNLGKTGRWGGACTAAGFLQHFIEGDTPWAHMDIAGTAWIKKDLPTVPKFGTGFGVRVLDRLIANHYES